MRRSKSRRSAFCVTGIEGYGLGESVERKDFPERFGFELFGDPYEKKRRWQQKQREKVEAERGDLGAWEREEAQKLSASLTEDKQQKKKNKKKNKKKKKKKTKQTNSLHNFPTW